MKILGYYLFAFIYYIFNILPVRNKKILCIMTHDDGDASNVSIMAKALKEADKAYRFAYITRTETKNVKGFKSLGLLIKFFIKRPYDMATSQYILLDNVFLPYAYIKRRKSQKVIQLWHGTGTIKKFGQDFNKGRLKQLEKNANSQITHLIINTESMESLYKGAFGIESSKIYALGLPKSDELLKRIIIRKKTKENIDKKELYRKYNIDKNKKLILYAPTFRDEKDFIELHLQEIMEDLHQDYCLGLRLHPFVAQNYIAKELPEGVIQLSFEKDLNTLMMASDILVTDYSSILFDYCLLDKPIVLFPYDYEEFIDDGRNFYVDYKTYVPGDIGYTGKEIGRLISAYDFDMDRIRRFKEEHYKYLDGKAVERITKLMESIE